MHIPVKTLPNGFSLPQYGFGLWQMGGRAEPDTSNDAREIEALQAAIAAGVTHFDTAEQYAAGHSEELLGQAICGYERTALQIATKVSAWNQRYDDLLRSFDASLARLRTDYIDLYLLHHCPRPDINPGETMRAMDRLVAEGRVRHIGACNLSLNRLQELQKRTANPIVCNQIHYNVQYREPEATGLLTYCQEHSVMVVAWRPMQKGSLPMAPITQELATKYNRTPNQILINWLTSQEGVVVIAKTSNLEHLRENLGAVGWEMDAEDVERIRHEFPDQKTVSDAVPLDYPACIAL